MSPQSAFGGRDIKAEMAVELTSYDAQSCSVT
jgi:hypothetical protein